MSAIELRPRFRMETELTPHEIIERFRVCLKEQNPGRLQATLMDSHILLRFPKIRQKLWTPQLDIMLEHDLEKRVNLLRCLIAPAPGVWTMFMFFYISFAFIAMLGLMIGTTQITLGNPVWGFWLVAGSAVGALLFWFLAQQGKEISKSEMQELKVFLLHVLGEDGKEVEMT